MDKNTIVICMGSSCFARGNDINLHKVENYIKEHDLEGNITLKGCLCEGECSLGPNMIINGKTFNQVKPDSIMEILDLELHKKRIDQDV